MREALLIIHSYETDNRFHTFIDGLENPTGQLLSYVEEFWKEKIIKSSNIGEKNGETMNTKQNAFDVKLDIA